MKNDLNFDEECMILIEFMIQFMVSLIWIKTLEN